MGLMTSLLNSKTAVMYLSPIPQFIDPRAGRVLVQGFVYGGVQVVVSLAVNGAVVLAAGTVAAFLARRPEWLRVQRCVMGTVLGLLAVALAADRSGPAPV